MQALLDVAINSRVAAGKNQDKPGGKGTNQKENWEKALNMLDQKEKQQINQEDIDWKNLSARTCWWVMVCWGLASGRLVIVGVGQLAVAGWQRSCWQG